MSRRSDRQRPEFVFVPIGGVGEIGMNLYLYGYGPPDDREWLIVDLGITFGGDTEPGIDVILPDITFLEAERPNLKGLLLTHAHEDHFGAVSLALSSSMPATLPPLSNTSFGHFKRSSERTSLGSSFAAVS